MKMVSHQHPSDMGMHESQGLLQDKELWVFGRGGGNLSGDVPGSPKWIQTARLRRDYKAEALFTLT